MHDNAFVLEEDTWQAFLWLMGITIGLKSANFALSLQ
jgi:hypothetical protein